LARSDVPSYRPRVQGPELYARDARGDRAASRQLSHTGRYRPGWSQTPREMSALVLQLDVLVDRERVQGHPVERVVGHARAHAAQRAVVHDRQEHRAVDRELLDLVEDRLALRDVALLRLLQEELVDVRVAAVGVRPLRIDELADPAGRVAGVTHRRH